MLLRLGKNPEQQVSWCHLVSDSTDLSEVSVQYGSLEEAALELAGKPVVVFAPASEVVLHRVELPIRNRQRLRAAIPFALEDSLIPSIDETHFAFAEGRKGEKKGVLVAAVAHSKIQYWLALLKKSALRVERLVPEQFGFSGEGKAALWLDQGQSYLSQLGSEWVWSLEPKNLERVITLLPQEERKVVLHRVEGVADPLCSGVEVQHEFPPVQNLLSVIASTWVLKKSADINLLQGVYSPGERRRQLMQYWKGTALLVVTVLLLMMISTWMLVVEKRAEHGQYQKQIESLYRQTFPAAKRVVNPRLQMERKLIVLNQAEQPGADTPLQALEKVSNVLKKRILNNKEGGKLQIMNFKGGVFDLSLKVKSLLHLDELKESLADETGYGVEIVNASSVEGEIEGRVKITLPIFQPGKV